LGADSWVLISALGTVLVALQPGSMGRRRSRGDRGEKPWLSSSASPR